MFVRFKFDSQVRGKTLRSEHLPEIRFVLQHTIVLQCFFQVNWFHCRRLRVTDTRFQLEDCESPILGYCDCSFFYDFSVLFSPHFRN